MIKRILLIATVALALSGTKVLRAADPHAAPEKAAVEHSSAVTEHSAAHGEGEKPELLPNLAAKETWYSALWIVIIFVVLLAILYPTAWKNILTGLENREKRIREDIANAEAARVRAEGTLKEYQAQLATAESKVREMISSAVTEGEKMAAAIKARGQQEAEETRTRAIKEIETAKKQALAEIYHQAAELSTSIASKILRRSINAADQQDLVRRSLDELHTVRS